MFPPPFCSACTQANQRYFNIMMEKLSFLGCKYFQLVHHIWRHIPSFTRQLRWIVLWTDTYASSFWQPLLNGYVDDMLNSQLLFHINNIFLNSAFFFSALRYSTNDGEFKDNALRLTNSLINIRLEYLLLWMLVLIWKCWVLSFTCILEVHVISEGDMLWFCLNCL